MGKVETVLLGWRGGGHVYLGNDAPVIGIAHPFVILNLVQDNMRPWFVILKQVQDDELWGKGVG